MRGYFFAYFLENDMALRTSLVAQPHLYMGDTTGRPLDGGKVYFGQVNKDPEFYPINIFYDEKLTIAAPQPVLTKGGFMYANGDMTEIYAAETRYSVKVLDRYGRQVFYKPDMQSGLDISNELNSVAELSSLTDALDGNMVFVKNSQGGVFVYDSSKSAINDGGLVINGWVRQLQTPYITPEMFGCKGDGVTDDTTAMQRFSAAEHPHKLAAKKYKLTGQVDFNITHQNTIIDFGASTIVGTVFSRYPLGFFLEIPVNTLTFNAGNFDGGDNVNFYAFLRSTGNGFCEAITINCKGVIKNLSNKNNTATTTAINCGIACNIVTVNNPVVYNVHNVSGVSGSSSAIGIFISQFRKLGIVNDPIISNIYTTSGVDADGIVMFEEKDLPTTGTALAIINNPKLTNCYGRCVKSQCNLEVNNTIIEMSPPDIGVVANGWRGIDAQLGALRANNTNFVFKGVDFLADRDNALFCTRSNYDKSSRHCIEGVSVTGTSNIRYLFLVTSVDCKSVYINNVTINDPQPSLSCLYVVRQNVSDYISITNLKGNLSNPEGRVFFDLQLTGTTKNLVLENIQWSIYPNINVSNFSKIQVINNYYNIIGTLDYYNISKNSDFKYFYETVAAGGITYGTTAQAIPSWASRDCKYEKGNVLSTLKDKLLFPLGSNFYSITLPAAVKVPDKV